MRIRFSKSLAYLSESYSGALSLYEIPSQSSILSQSGFPTTGYDDPIHSTKIEAQRLHDKATKIGRAREHACCTLPIY